MSIGVNADLLTRVPAVSVDFARQGNNVAVPLTQHIKTPFTRSATGAAPVVLSLDTVHESGLPSGETELRMGFGGLSHRRRAGFFIAGGLCAAGVLIALSTQTTAPSVDSASTSTSPTPWNTSNTQTPFTAADLSETSDGEDRDPRAVVVDLALSGRLDGIPPDIDDVTADVVSRNGDIVLVDATASVNSTQSKFSVVLVRTDKSWVVREIFASADTTESSPSN